MKPHRIVIEGGAMKFVYDDGIATAMKDTGPMEVRRASHVEPHPTKQGWLADMAPSGGPVIGAVVSVMRPHRECDCLQCEAVAIDIDPFATRQEAIDAELAWLREHRGL